MVEAIGGRQQHEKGTLVWEGGSAPVTDVRSQDGDSWSAVEGEMPSVGTAVRVTLDRKGWQELVRTHTALHMCGRRVVSEAHVVAEEDAEEICQTLRPVDATTRRNL